MSCMLVYFMYNNSDVFLSPPLLYSGYSPSAVYTYSRSIIDVIPPLFLCWILPMCRVSLVYFMHDNSDVDTLRFILDTPHAQCSLCIITLLLTTSTLFWILPICSVYFQLSYYLCSSGRDQRLGLPIKADMY